MMDTLSPSTASVRYVSVGPARRYRTPDWGSSWEDLRSCSSWTRNLEVRLTSYSVVGETKDEEVVEGTYDGYLVVLDSAGHLSENPISDTKRGA